MFVVAMDKRLSLRFLVACAEMKEGKGTNEDAIVCWREIVTKRGGEGERGRERNREKSNDNNYRENGISRWVTRR